MRLNVVFLDCTKGYGYLYSACNTKTEFMAKGLTECGDLCFIHNGTGGRRSLSIPEYTEKKGIATVVDYSLKYKWYISRFLNFPLLVSDLKRWKRQDAKNVVIIEAPYLPYFYLDILAARKAGYKIAVISHEWLGTFKNKNRVRRWFYHRYANVFGYYADAILPISEYIIKRIQKFKKPFLKVPIEADFSLPPQNNQKENYFLYCVSADYIRVIEMVITGFKMFASKYKNYKLILVLSGSQSAIDATYRLIDSQGMNDIVDVKHKIPYSELLHLNRTASGLIVPLDPNFEQDEARFSQKIAEYLSSGTVIISNNVGEVKHYFIDKDNILINDYSSEGFQKSFDWIAAHPDEAIKIGHRGFLYGKEIFDYHVCGKQLHDFLSFI